MLSNKSKLKARLTQSCVENSHEDPLYASSSIGHIISIYSYSYIALILFHHDTVCIGILFIIIIIYCKILLNREYHGPDFLWPSSREPTDWDPILGAKLELWSLQVCQAFILGLRGDLQGFRNTEEKAMRQTSKSMTSGVKAAESRQSKARSFNPIFYMVLCSLRWRKIWASDSIGLRLEWYSKWKQ